MPVPFLFADRPGALTGIERVQLDADLAALLLVGGGIAVASGLVADGNLVTGTGTDNSAALQAAINAQGTPGSLIIPKGNYRLASQVTLPSNFTLYGAGNLDTTLFANSTFTNSGGLIRTTGAGGPPTVIQDMGIVGAVGGAGAGSVGLFMAANATIARNLWLSAFNTNCVIAQSDCYLLASLVEEPLAGGIGIDIRNTNVTVSDCETYHCSIGLQVNNVTFVDGVVSIDNVRSLACTSRGFLIQNSDSVNLSNCSVGHNNLGGYATAGFDILTSNRVSMSNCTGRLGGGTPSSTGIGIHLDSSSDCNITGCSMAYFINGIQPVNCGGINIVGGNYSNNGFRGAFMSGGDRISCTGLQCFSNGGLGAVASCAGIWSDNTATFASHSIVGCLNSEPGGGGQGYGIVANLTNNGGSSGFTNLASNMNRQNNLAPILTGGLVANINQSGNF